LISLTVVAYVWQNIEVMKINLEYRKHRAVEKKLIMENDGLLYRIERYRTMKYVEEAGYRKGYVPIEPGKIDVIRIKEKNEPGNNKKS
jgi:hypothetical protein